MSDANLNDRITVGLVTAVPVECAAVRRRVDGGVEHRVSGDPNHYVTGTMPSSDADRPHRVIVAMQTRDGTRDAAAIATDLTRSFPGLRVLLMCGIAAGAPGYRDPLPVRPGDLAIATKGIVDYAHVRAVDGTRELRRHLNGLSAALLRADRELQVDEHNGGQRWPAALSTVLPHRSAVGDAPAVHRGAIGSADVLLRDAVLRDDLAARYDLCAFEMEGSGIAVGADLHDKSWFVVRGVSDSGDAAKDDSFHGYAADVAAAYTRALLAVCAPMDELGDPPPPVHRQADGLETIVTTLLGLRLFRDDNQRREVLDQLPEHIRTSISDHPAGRLHVLGIVRACEDFEDEGREALIDALRLAMGAASPEFRRVSEVVRANWAPRRR
jgi:nucleoside phosphorylase